MRLTVLASGSGGNSILVEADRTRVLVDAGLAPRDIARRIDRTVTGARLDDVQAVIVTHEHEDHASGAPALASAGLTLFCTAGTARAAKLARTREICAGETTGVGALEVLPVTLPHDAAEHVGLILRDEGGSAGIILDCGHADADAARAFAACDVLILETNHDPDLLKAGSYPPFLKRRIGSRLGHLSNGDAADFLRFMGRPRVQVLVLAHLSQMNNRPRLARAEIDKALKRLGIRPRVLVAVQEKPTAPIACVKGTTHILPASDDRQLCLAFPD
ncbi:MAG TPA: MBL fold metallo-hydrolase [Haliangiales bacterium]|nr:MBL fold metallo-hydrolase [Haliangiales bacterium]